jgi:superfamily II DNA or RNA helicase
MKGNGILNKEKFKDFKHINFDLLVIDEIHKGKETRKSDKIFKMLNYKKLLGLSATPTKNLIRGTFINDNTHRFSVEDMTKYKKLYPGQYINIPV